MKCNLNVLEDFLGEEVVDMEGNPVGTFACYWEREQKSALLLGVDIPERSGHTHIVPAQNARCNERQTYVVVPFSRAKIIQAPCLACDSEMDEVFERRIWAFYGLPIPGAVAAEPLSQKAEAAGQQMRRVVGSGGPAARCAPPRAAATTPTKKAHPPGLGPQTRARRPTGRRSRRRTQSQ